MGESKVNLDLIFGGGWHVNSDKINRALGFISGSGSPVSSVTPEYLGQQYFDTSGLVWYQSIALTSADWAADSSTDTAAELAVLHSVVAGTASASKAVVLGASKNVDTMEIDALNVGKDAVAGTLAIFPTTTATGKTTFTASSNSGATTTNINTAAQTGARTYTVPDAGASASFVMTQGSATIAGALTLTAAALTVGLAGTNAGNLTLTSATAAKGTLQVLAADSAGNTATVITNASQSGARTYTIPDAGGAASFLMTAGNQTLTGQLTAAAGTTAIAPLVFQSGTNLTTAAIGAHEFDGVCFYETSVASARQVVNTEQFVCLTANGPTDSNSLLDAATAAAVFRTPTNGTITVAAATSYFFEAMYKLSNTGTTSHTWATLFAGTATFTSISYTALAYTGTTSGVTISALSALQIAVATQVPVTAASTSATEFVTVWLRGIMRINAGGTVIPQMQASARPGASGTPGVTILAGSYFRAWPVGSNTVASVGNWS